MANDIETEIRKALDHKAHEVDVPADLARRTIDSARAAQPSLRERLRARADAWRIRAPVTGYPRWMYAGAAAATAGLLFVVGTFVTRPSAVIEEPAAGIAEPQPLPATGAESRVAKDEALVDAPAQAEQARGGGGEDAGATGQAQRGVAPEQIEPPVPQRPGQLPPKIVRTADLEVEVRDFDRAWSAANDLASKHGGFVTSSNTEQSGDKLNRGHITLRVPAAKLEAALRDLRRLGKVARESSSGEDVSAQLVDIGARVRALEAEELQLLELLRKASGVSQILEVRDRLNGVRQEIESLKAQKEFFDTQVEFSTINATLFEKGAEPTDEPPGDGILPEAWRTALRVGLTIVAGALVVLGGLIPLAAAVGALWLVYRTVRRRRSA